MDGSNQDQGDQIRDYDELMGFRRFSAGGFEDRVAEEGCLVRALATIVGAIPEDEDYLLRLKQLDSLERHLPSEPWPRPEEVVGAFCREDTELGKRLQEWIWDYQKLEEGDIRGLLQGGRKVLMTGVTNAGTDDEMRHSFEIALHDGRLMSVSDSYDPFGDGGLPLEGNFRQVNLTGSGRFGAFVFKRNEQFE